MVSTGESSPVGMEQPISCDVTDQEQVRSLVDQATQRFGRIDMVVNNAGLIQVGPMSATTKEDFANALDVMFWGTLSPTLAVLPQMRVRRSRRVVNITSIGGIVSVPHLFSYTCTQFAAVGLSEGLRAELGQEGIHLTTVVPGLMRTGSYMQARFKGQPERAFAWCALGSTLSPLSMSAERAAQQTVRATQRRTAECILRMLANILGRMHGLYPGTTTNLLSLVNRFLPETEAAPATSALGQEVRRRLRSRLLHALTGLGRAATHRLHQRHTDAASALATPAQRPYP
jgi:NADP-dependent 3-hydroxy acid dehydrogenase YdfG